MAASGLQIGLALGSGVARGWAHIGILRAFQRAGIAIDVLCGTSMGALVGGVFLGERLDELEEWARALNKFRLTRLFDFQFGHGGLIAGRRIVEMFHPELRERLIESLPVRFACVATELGTGHEVWLQKGSLIDAMRASYALPGIFSPVLVDGRWLLDGALVNPIPVSVCRALGARLVVAVNLNTGAFGEGVATGPEDPATETEPLEGGGNGNGSPGSTFLRQLFSRANSEPSLLTVMESALNIMQDRLTRSRLAGEPPDVTIAPRVAQIGLLQFDRAAEAIAAGERATEEALPAIEEALRRLQHRR
jgi:NTE family protein